MMRTLSRAALILCFAACAPNRREEPVKNDPLLEKVKSSLPPGWTLALAGSTLTIERREKAWVLFENRVNAPMSRETAAARSARIRKEGQATTCRFVFRCEERWAPERIAKAREENAAVERQIADLPAKHDVARLRDESLSRKGEDVYSPKTPEDRQRLEEFRAEQKALRDRLKRLPDLHSERYSLFLAERAGMEDDMHVVDPPEASRDMYAIDSTLREILKAE